MLIIFSGLPGTGKTTLATRLARIFSAVYLRMDSLEMALVRSGLVADQWALGPAGYYAGYALALDNLGIGATVVADCVNPLKITRDAWRDVAIGASHQYLEVEILCSDTAEHKKRVSLRKSDIDGLQLPTWSDIVSREYEQWDREHVVIDTAVTCVDAAVQNLAEIVRQMRAG